MTFKIEKVEVKNFLSYSEAAVELPPGFVILHGENGAGKTSLIDAIAYALSSKPASRRGIKQAELVRKGSTSASVKLYFELGPRKYMVERRFGINKVTEAYLYDLSNKRRIAHGTTNVNKEIAKLLGFESINAAIESMFVPQGRLTELIELGPSELRDKVIEIVGIGKRENIINKLNEVIRVFENRASKLELKAKLYKQQQEKLNNLKKRRNSLVIKVNEERKKLSEIESELKRIEEKFEELRRKYELYNKLNEELSRKVAKLNEIVEQLKELNVSDEMVYSIKEQIKEREEALKERASIESDLIQLREIKQIIEEIEKLKEELMKINVDEKTKEKIEEELKGLREKKELLRADLSIAKERYNNTLKDLERKRTSLMKIKSMLKGKSLDELIAEIVLLEDEVEELKKREETLRTLKAELEAKLSLVRDSLEALKRSEGKCPVCGAPLTEGRKKELIEAKMKEEEKIEKELRRVIEELKEIETQLKIKERELERLKETYNKVEAVLDNLGYDDVTSLENEVHNMEKELKDYEEQINNMKKEYNHITRREKELSLELEKAIRDLKRKAELSAMLSEKEKSLRYGLSRVGLEDPTEVNRLLKEYEKKIEYMRKLEDEKARLEKLLDELQEKLRKKSELEGIKKSIEAEIDAIRSEINEMKFDPNEFEEVMEKYEEIKDKKERILEELRKHEGMLKELENQIEEKIKEIKDLENSAKEYEELRNYIDFLNSFKTKIPSIYNTISEGFRKAWEAEANKLLQNFDLSISSIRINREKKGRSEGWSIEAIGDSGRELKVDSLSGGEKVGVSLALKLALVKMLSRGKVSVLILDEPTVNLDEERKRRLKEILLRAVGPTLHQLIVVTHDQEVLDVAEHLCRVKKGSRGSEVICHSQ